MSADDPVGVVLTDHFYQRCGIELVKKQPSLFVLPRLVELIVHPAEKFRSAVNEIDIRFAIEAAKERVGEFQHVLVPNLVCEARYLECLFQRLSGDRVTVADGGREDKNTSVHRLGICYRTG